MTELASSDASLAQRIPPHSLIAREGWPFVGGALGLAALGAVLHTPFWIGVGLLVAVCCALFFRNPQRTTPADPDAVISPADGRVLTVETHNEPFFERGLMQRITVFLSVADVHINRMPFDGRVLATRYKRGDFLMAYAPEASTRNECNAIHLQSATDSTRESVWVQIAGKIARRIVCYVRSGDVVEAGMRCGLIRFGSRVDIYVPQSAQVMVQPGMRVVGGETIVARFATGGTNASTNG